MLRPMFMAILALLVSTASAAAMDEDLSRVETPVLALIEQYPGVADVRTLISEDCRTQHSSMTEVEVAPFCRCGSALTIQLWLQSEQMVALLNEYLAAPDDQQLANFVNYQGPELYAGYCRTLLGN